MDFKLELKRIVGEGNFRHEKLRETPNSRAFAFLGISPDILDFLKVFFYVKPVPDDLYPAKLIEGILRHLDSLIDSVNGSSAKDSHELVHLDLVIQNEIARQYDLLPSGTTLEPVNESTRLEILRDVEAKFPGLRGDDSRLAEITGENYYRSSHPLLSVAEYLEERAREQRRGLFLSYYLLSLSFELHKQAYTNNHVSIGGDKQDSMVRLVKNLTFSLALVGRYDEAIEVINDTLDSNRVWFDSRRNILVDWLGLVYLSKGDFVRAECCFKEAQRRDVRYVEGNRGFVLYNYHLGLTLIRNGQSDYGRKFLEKISTVLDEDTRKEYSARVGRLTQQIEKSRRISSS